MTAAVTTLKSLVIATAATLALSAHAAGPEALQTTGTLVVVPASGEVRHANDQVVATLAIEEQDKDKAVAASRVNTKMRQGLDILKKEDPVAMLKTQGYYTYPVYSEERPLPNGQAARQRVITGWRVGQYVHMTTTNLDKLPKTVAAAQKLLALNNLQFGLTPETTRQLDEARIAAAYRNLNDRVSFMAKAMGRNAGDAVLEAVDFEGTGNYLREAQFAAPAPLMMRTAKMADDSAVAEPSFEPGETTVQVGLVAKVRFK